ncbi:MAG: sigma-70 family RNA polymerase sigma factor [Opitutaceae bacterium]
MKLTDDAELLRLYVHSSSEAAFAELVRRYIKLVYQTARRQVGSDGSTAEDVTQTVFSLLARKAALLTRHQSLAGWLHTTSRFAASQAIRTERRRRSREQEAHLMQELSNDCGSTTDWDQLRPVIDEVLGELNESDRETVLLRYFADLPLAQIGAKFKITENTARMRVDRALGKLHALLTRRGVTSTSAMLATMLVSEANGAMPAALAATVTSTALAGKIATATSMMFMSTSKFSVGITAVVVAAGVLGVALQYRANIHLRDSVASLQQKNEELARQRPENERSAKVRTYADVPRTPLQAENTRSQTSVAATSSRQPGEISQTRESLSELKSETPLLPSPFQISSRLEGRYTGLIKALNLTPSQWDQIRTLLLAKQQAAEDAVETALRQGLNTRRNLPAIREIIAEAQAPVNARIQAALGDGGYAQFQHYEQTLPQRVTVNDLAQMLRTTPTPLTDDQARQMVEILTQTEEPQGKGGIGRILNGNVNNHSKITALTIVRSTGVLSDAQIEALKQLQQQQLGVTIDASAGPDPAPRGN